MSIVCITSDRTQFEEWMNKYTSGDILAFPLYDPTGYFESLLREWEVETTFSPYIEIDRTSEVIFGKYLFVIRDSPFYKIRFFVAKMLQAQVVEVCTLEDIPLFLDKHYFEQVLLLVSLDQINHSFYRFYIRTVMKRCPASIITAKSLMNLSWLLVKSKVQAISEGELVLLPRSNRNYSNNTKSRIVTNTEDMYQISNEILKSEFLEIFAVSAHGTEDVITLKDFIICGKSKLNIPRGMTCELGVNCPVGDRGFSPDNIKARISIINSCMGVRLNDSMLPIEVSLAMTFLENHVATYIGSNTVKYGPDAEVCLLQNFLKYGYSSGQATRMTNFWLEQKGFDFPCFSVIGDVDMRISQRNYCSTEYEWMSNTELIVIPNKHSLLEVELINYEVGRYEYVQVSSKSEIFYAIITDPEIRKTKLFLFSWEPIMDDILKITLHTKQELQLIKEPLSRYTDSFSLQRHITGKKFHAQLLSTIYNQLDLIACKIGDIEYMATSFYKIQADILKLQGLIMNIQKEIMINLLSRASTDSSIWLPDLYLDFTQIIFEKLSEVNCFVCQSASIDVSFEHRVTKEVRNTLYCPRCGGITDIPDHPMIRLEIRGLNSVGNNETLIQVLVLENFSSAVVQGYAGMRLDSVKQYRVIVEPSYVFYTLNPGERKEYYFLFHLNKDIKPHLYYVKALLIHDVDLYYASKPIFINTGEL